MTPDSPQLESPAESAETSQSPGSSAPGRRGRLVSILAGIVALAVLGGAAALWSAGPFESEPPDPVPSGAQGRPTPPTPTSSPDLATARADAVEELLAARSRAVLDRDPAAWQALVDPTDTEFAAEQARLIERLGEVPFAEWAYQVVGDGPGLPAERAAALPEGSAIVRVRLTYRIEATQSRTDREQYLTVVPRGGRWLLAGDTDAAPSGFESQRDLWDLGPVRLVRGEHSTVVADRRGASTVRAVRLAREADAAVQKVDQVWRSEWSRRPVLVLPRSQKDMATLIGDDGEGLAQIAAVTTGAFEDGLSRGDRVVINPAAFATLGSLGRAVVLTHEITHVATRSTSVIAPPIWLSEGFADYVAYEATPVATAIVAADVIDDVRDGEAPRRLPEQADFDAGEGDIAAAYEGAWLAAKMIAERYGERALVRFYVAMSDSAGPGWPEESEDVLGITAKQFTRDWRGYLREVASSR